jgi:hypothetical protein
MKRWGGVLSSSLAALAALILASLSPFPALAKDSTKSNIEDRLERLEENQGKLEEELKAKDERIQELEAKLGNKKTGKKEKKDTGAPATSSTPATSDTELKEQPEGAAPPPEEAKKDKEEKTLEEHVPYSGVKLFKNNWVELRFTPYAYVRYLNQKGIDTTRTDSFGRTFDVPRQNSFQLGKVMLQFKGWLGTPKFRYYLYTWTSNASMGEGAQVVVGGNLSYLFHPHFNLGLGIAALPSTRSTTGTFPFWLRVDARPMADEYFRSSYTTGIYAWGDVIGNLHYKTMLGNNMSQLGVSQAQLDEGLNTWATSLWWTTDGYGAYEGMGDYDYRDQPTATFGGAYTRSRETKQSQPGKNDPENTQIRLSDGTAIFDPEALAPGTQVEKATYQMAVGNAGVKYRGFSFDFDYFFRWVNDLDITGTLPAGSKASFFDHGFQAQASYMLIRRRLQVYGIGSTIFGQFGVPWEAGGGFNVFPLKSTKEFRVNIEVDYARHSPTGYNAYPLAVGANGPIFMTNVEAHY